MNLVTTVSTLMLRQFWPALLLLISVNLAFLFFISENRHVNGDDFTVRLLATLWFLENAAFAFLIGHQNGHASLWQQLWPTFRSRSIAMLFPLSIISLGSQLLPVTIWLMIQTQTVSLDIIALVFTWVLSLFGAIAALMWLGQPTWRNTAIFMTGLLSFIWTLLPMVWQLLIPAALFIFLLSPLFIAEQRINLWWLVVQTLALIAFVFLCIFFIENSNQLERSRENTTALLTQPDESETQLQWIDEVTVTLRKLPTPDQLETTERLPLPYAFPNLAALATQDIAQPRSLVFNGRHPIYADWIDQTVKLPLLPPSTTSPFKFFAQQNEVIWQTQQTTTPIVHSFSGGQLVLTSHSVMWFSNNQSRILWRSAQKPLTWFALHNDFPEAYLVFGNSDQLFSVYEQDASLQLSTFDIDQRPAFVALQLSSERLRWIDVYTTPTQGKRLAWFNDQPSRIVESSFTTSPKKTLASIQCVLSAILPAWLPIKCEQFKAPIPAIGVSLLAGILTLFLSRRIQHRRWRIYSAFAFVFSVPWILVILLQRQRLTKPPS